MVGMLAPVFRIGREVVEQFAMRHTWAHVMRFAPSACGMRRPWLIIVISLQIGAASLADEVPPAIDPLSEEAIIERVTGAIDRGLAYMASKERLEGGWFDNQAVNGLACLAFMGRGHVPGRGPYRDVLEKAKRAILAAQDDAGIIISKGQMYEHGLATLALAELYGMDYDPLVEEGLRKAVNVIVRAQSDNGGWRYKPEPGDHDLSVTVMQVVALRAANNAEVPVPVETIQKAKAYVRSCAVPSGGFGYQPGQGPKPQMSVAGVLSLQLMGEPNDPSIPKALDYYATADTVWNGDFWFYRHYYAIQATYQAGGDYWNAYHPRIRAVLLANQNDDGSWGTPSGDSHEANAGVVGGDSIYSTAMACLILEIYNHFLPAYQR